jgi:hypothetical protein
MEETIKKEAIAFAIFCELNSYGYNSDSNTWTRITYTNDGLLHIVDTSPLDMYKLYNPQ